MCRSRESESETSLSSPLNHCAYRQASAPWMRDARCLAATSFAVVSVSSLFSSWKLDFRSQPVAVVLSPIDRIQDCGGTLPFRMSSQMQMMLAMNSKRLMCARDRRWVGRGHRHARPSAE